MYINLGNYDLDVKVVEEDNFKSKFTGKILSKYEIRFTIKGTEKNQLFLDLKKSAKEGSIDLISNDLKFEIVDSSYSYRDELDPEDIEYNHTLFISEIENKLINRLFISNINLIPYVYEEQMDYDSLIITFNAEISIEDFAKIKQLKYENSYFKVVREGISNEEFQMRFGRILWSLDETESIVKLQATLVEQKYDENNTNGFSLFMPEMPNMQSIVSKNTEVLEMLLQILKEKNILLEEEFELLKNPSKEMLFDRELDLYKVKDLDEFLSKYNK